VRVAVFEFHDDMCDTQQCRCLLNEYGFTHRPCSARIHRPPFTVCGAKH
jgi:hypothetical protein